jgi:hypothetical protein
MHSPKNCLLLLLLAGCLTSCFAERVRQRPRSARIKMLQEGRAYDSSTPRNDLRPILTGATQGQQRRGLPANH